MDRGALDAALELGAECGGWCPAGRLAEDGTIPERYPVMEMPTAAYSARTARNVAESHGTLVICNGEARGGTRETLEFCREQGRPHLVIDCEEVAIEAAIDRAVEFVQRLSSRADARDPTSRQNATRELRGSSPSARLGITILNVAGPRASQWADGHEVAHQIVAALLRRLGGHQSGPE